MVQVGDDFLAQLEKQHFFLRGTGNLGELGRALVRHRLTLQGSCHTNNSRFRKTLELGSELVIIFKRIFGHEQRRGRFQRQSFTGFPRMSFQRVTHFSQLGEYAFQRRVAKALGKRIQLGNLLDEAGEPGLIAARVFEPAFLDLFQLILDVADQEANARILRIFLVRRRQQICKAVGILDFSYPFRHRQHFRYREQEFAHQTLGDRIGSLCLALDLKIYPSAQLLMRYIG